MSLIINTNRKKNDMITMNDLNEQFNETFECENTIYVPDNQKHKSTHTPFDEANFYIQQVRNLKINSDAYSVSV
jgi:hypothetical protein